MLQLNHWFKQKNSFSILGKMNESINQSITCKLDACILLEAGKFSVYKLHWVLFKKTSEVLPDYIVDT